MALVLTYPAGPEGTRVDLVNTGQSPVPAVARELTAADLPGLFPIQTDQIADLAVTEAKIGDFEITPNKLNTGAVTTPKIETGAVTTPKIADAAVGLAKLTGGVVASLLAQVPSAGAATTNLSAGVITLPANSIIVGDTYQAVVQWQFTHAAASTPTITIEWVLGGNVIQTRVINVTATAGTYQGSCRGIFRFSSLGATGGARVTTETLNNVGFALSDQVGMSVAQIDGAPTINTTISNTLEFRMRMTTAVASNTLTLFQAFIDKLINR